MVERWDKSEFIGSNWNTFPGLKNMVSESVPSVLPRRQLIEKTGEETLSFGKINCGSDHLFPASLFCKFEYDLTSNGY